MKYISQDSQQPLPSPHNGFWVRDDTIFDVTTSSHVKFIIENTSLFNLTGEQIADIYKKHGEVVGTEMSAREELVRYATSLGWIRVRHYPKERDFWSIQADDTNKRRFTIAGFLRWAIECKVMERDSSAVIVGFDDPQDRLEYDWKQGGIGEYLHENEEEILITYGPSNGT